MIVTVSVAGVRGGGGLRRLLNPGLSSCRRILPKKHVSEPIIEDSGGRQRGVHQPRQAGAASGGHVDAYPDWQIPGTVIATIPTADHSKATVKVRIAIKQPDPRIVPDMGVRVAFLDPHPARPVQLTTGVLVPPEAVRAEGAVGVVFVLSAAGKVERRSVTLGATVGGHRQVLSGHA